MTVIEYRTNQSGARDVAIHLERCDAEFVPPLGDRVCIDEYAVKLVSNAQRFEAWQDETMVGLVAMYCGGGRFRSRTAFISSVSVLPKLCGQGLASALLDRAIQFARHAGMRKIELEMDQRNFGAWRLYRNKGFVIKSESGVARLMQLML